MTFFTDFERQLSLCELATDCYKEALELGQREVAEEYLDIFHIYKVLILAMALQFLKPIDIRSMLKP